MTSWPCNAIALGPECSTSMLSAAAICFHDDWGSARMHVEPRWETQGKKFYLLTDMQTESGSSLLILEKQGYVVLVFLLFLFYITLYLNDLKLLLKNQMSFSPFPCQAKILGIQTIWGLLWLYIATAGAKSNLKRHLPPLGCQKELFSVSRLDFLGRQWGSVCFFFPFIPNTQHGA